MVSGVLGIGGGGDGVEWSGLEEGDLWEER